MEYTLKTGDVVILGGRVFDVTNSNITMRHSYDDDDVRLIIDTVISYYNVNIDRLRDNNNLHNNADARMALFYFLREYGNLTYCNISTITNRRHCTVIQGRRKFETLVSTNDRQTVTAYISIKNELNINGLYEKNELI